MIAGQGRNEALREAMVARQLRARGILSPLVLAAMRKVPRDRYVPSYLGEFAYEDSALPIEEEQTISQPYIVGYMLEALQLRGGERVLEVGTGSGYAAAVLAEIAAEVYTIERHERLATTARERLQRDGYTNVHVRHGDGTLGWSEHAPFDAIVVAAGGPRVPDSLRQQLAIGGRMVLPVGDAGSQQLVRVTRRGPDDFHEQRLAGVRFVPLIGEEGWRTPSREHAAARRQSHAGKTIARGCEPFPAVDSVDLRPMLQRIGDARVVLLGEATHGTAEFYRFRDVLTRELVQQKGFDVVALEADWPDAARIDHYVRDRATRPAEWQAFARFPTWMWRNREFATFVDWLRMHNGFLAPDRRVRLAGLDLYAMHTSSDVVLRHLDAVDPATAAVARHRYGCLTPWHGDPAAYGRAVLTGAYRSCEPDVVRVLEHMLRQRLDGDDDTFDALQNARLVANAEHYYRAMYYGSHEAWNLRDRHMFDCLRQLLVHHGDRSRIVVWAHNSHVGDARATEMPARGESNLGQLCREELPAGSTYIVGFGTHEGTVAAASYWGGDVEFKQLRPSLPDSHERLCHDSGVPSFLLPLRTPRVAELHDLLGAQRMQRAVGVVYRPETERASHYQHVELQRQFDEYVWFERTTAVAPLTTADLHGVPDTYPFGL